MKLSDGVETAIHCTSALAGLPENAVMAAADLAEFHGVSSSYLLKHLKALVKAGILTSVPGPTGGYRMQRPAETVTLLDVVLAVEGNEPAFRCKEIRKNGPCTLGNDAFPRPCNINRAMLKAEQAYRAVLAETSIADLNSEFLNTGDPRVIDRAETYFTSHARVRTP